MKLKGSTTLKQLDLTEAPGADVEALLAKVVQP
jgi:hypothetical protein